MSEELLDAWVWNTEALDHFHLDQEGFHTVTRWWFRRSSRADYFDEYLDRTVFYRPRPFHAMHSATICFPVAPFEVLKFAGAHRLRQILHGTIKNKSLDLNYYRIEKYGMRKIFRLFISSCFVGFRKPERDIYRLALETTQIPAAECCFIDDRALNLECAEKLGMQTIEMQQVEQLRGDLAKLGVSA
jgi:putative hydrolase of the HAD superfamily